MACAKLHDKANGTRLSSLLVDKGTEAMKRTFDNIHSPATLFAVLNANRRGLLRLKYKVINQSQWDALYPASGNPSSNDFDVTLLTILLRNICGLTTPATGWSNMPPHSDRSVEANIVRIKLFRNEVYAHVTTTEVNDTQFKNLWQKISEALVDLGTPKHEIDELKNSPLSPEEEDYVQKLRDWKVEEEEYKDVLHKLTRMVQDTKQHAETSASNVLEGTEEIMRMVQDTQQQAHGSASNILEQTEVIKVLLAKLSEESSTKDKNDEEILYQLAKRDFNGEVRSLVELFQPGTREWLLKRLDDWFGDLESRVMILTAGPGVGKSVFAAKVCQVFEEKGKLAACHFCKFNESNLRNPRFMIQSLASHMCENVEGFRKKLLEQLKRPHEVQFLADAFRVYLNDPLQKLETREPMLIVIDGLDESEANGKSELLELIAEEFQKLPEWIKILVTSRPEISVKSKLKHLKPVEILPDDEDNEADIEQYFNVCLPDISLNIRINELLVKKCQGSFLFAFHVQSELRELAKTRFLSAEEIENFLPQGIGSVYEKYFRRLERDLKLLNSQLDFRQLLAVLVSVRGPLPLSFLSALLKLPNGSSVMKNALRRVNESLSSLLVVHDDLITIFHKSLRDWLTTNGYEIHPYAVDGEIGDNYLWEECKKEYIKIKETYPNVELTSAMKYSVDNGWFHLVDNNNVNCFLETDWEWLVDPCIVHVIATVYPKECRYLLPCWETCVEKSSCSNEHVRRKVSWHCLKYEGVYFCNSFPGYLQDRVNDSPSDITSEVEKSEAKFMLNHSVWFEKLNSFDEDNSNPFLYGTLFESKISCIDVSRNQEYCAVGHEDGKITLLEFPHLREIGTASTGLNSPVPCCTFSPDNSVLLYGQLDYGLDIRTLNKSYFFTHCHCHFTDCSFSPSGGRLATADSSDTLRLWDVKGQCLVGLFRAETRIDVCAYSEYGLFLIGKSTVKRGDQLVAIWNTITLQRVDRRPRVISRSGYCDGIENLVRKTPLQIAEALISYDNTERDDVIFYVLPQCLPVSRLSNPIFTDGASVIRYRKTPSILKYHTFPNSLRVVDYLINDFAWQDTELPDCIRYSAFSMFAYDEAFLIQKANVLVSFKTPCEQQNPPHVERVITCSFSPDGSRLASCTDDGIIRVWDVHTSRVVHSFCCYSMPIACWWSKRYFWMFHLGLRNFILSRFPINQQLQITVFRREDHQVGCEYDIFSTFVEGVLVLRGDHREITVVSVTDEEFKPVTKLVTRFPVECTAVSPDGSHILLASCRGYEIWRTDNNHHQSYSLSYDKGWDWINHINCSITSDGELGIIVISETIFVVNMSLGGVLMHFPFQFFLRRFHTEVWAGRLFVVVGDGKNYGVMEIRSGKLLARYNNQRTRGLMDPHKDKVVFYRPQNILAVPNYLGHVEFIKIHVPQ